MDIFMIIFKVESKGAKKMDKSLKKLEQQECIQQQLTYFTAASSVCKSVQCLYIHHQH